MTEAEARIRADERRNVANLIRRIEKIHIKLPRGGLSLSDGPHDVHAC